MKRIIILLLVTSFCSWQAVAQVPGQFNYQAVARNAAGNPLQNQQIKVRLSIHHSSAAGPVQYSETRSVTTNQFGLFAVAVGSAGASDVTGTVHGTDWQNGSKYLQVEIDATGGNSFTDVGTTQLLSVPYALSSADNQWRTDGANISSKNSGGVGIGTAVPDPSAALDIKSASKGLLMPRVTSAQRMALASPAKGLLVYQVESPEGFYYNAGTPAAPDWILLGASGPQGPAGPAGPTGVVKGYSIAGTIAYPSNTLSFITPTITITLQQGQKVFLVATRALGGYAAASELGIYPAYQSTVAGSPIVNLGLGMFGNQVPANTRIPFTIHGVFENLPAGTYKFGMSGIVSGSFQWSNSEWGYVSALVY